MPDVTAVILAGGLGTRLRSVVPNLPKCLAEVNGKPFIFYILRQLVAAKVRRIVIAVNYLGEMISLQVGTEYLGVPIYYSYDEIENGGTGHALRAALPYINTDHVLVMNGDTYVDIDLNDFIWYVQYNSDYNNGLILNILGGPKNMGIYLFNTTILGEILPLNRSYSIENQLLSEIFDMSTAIIRTYIVNRPFIDIGTPESYAAANEFMKKIGK